MCTWPRYYVNYSVMIHVWECAYIRNSPKVWMTHMCIRPRHSVNYFSDAHVCLHLPKRTESLCVGMSESYDLLLCIDLVNQIIMIYFISYETFYKPIISQLAIIVNIW
jgi:hypothetical protein